VKLVADEGVDRQIVGRLRQDGHTVQYVAEFEPGISDDYVLTIANQENGPLLTADKDFGELIYRQKRITSGVILIRLAGLSPIQKAEIVSRGVNRHQHELPLSFTVITPGAIRIRRGAGQ
jgi:predicted nuclease of predicted toxin-antitoxin system